MRCATIRSFCAKALPVLLVLPGLLALSACGSETSGGNTGFSAFGDITVTEINLDGTPGPGCTPLTPGVPDPFPSTPTDFAVTGTGFSQLSGGLVTVRFFASSSAVSFVPGPTPFLGGTSGSVDVVGTVVSDTLICGTSPSVFLCGPASVFAFIEVILPSGVRDDSTAGPTFVVTINPPTVLAVCPNCVPSMVPTSIEIYGNFFGNPGDTVTVRFASAENLPGGDPIFNDGTSTTVDVVGTVSAAPVVLPVCVPPIPAAATQRIIVTTPRATNQIVPGPDPLQVISDALEDASIQVFIGNGSCSLPGAASTIQFNRPEGDDARNRNFVTNTFGGLDPVGGLRVPQTIPTTFRVIGSNDVAPAACPDPWAVVGETVQVIFSRPTGGPANAFQLDARGVGTADFDTVEGTIVSATEIRSETPRVRAATSFVPVIRIAFEDGTIIPVVNGAPATVFTWDAPPVINRGAAVGVQFAPTIANLNVGGGANVGILGAEPATTFLGCHSSRMEITGANFQVPVDGGPPAADIGPARVFLFDAVSGTDLADPAIPWSVGEPVRRLGTGNPTVFTTANSAPAFGTGPTNLIDLGVEAPLTGTGNAQIPDYVVVGGTTITGSTRIDGKLDELDKNLDGLVRVRVRITNPDGQVFETNSFDPAGGFIRDMDYRLTHTTPVDRTSDAALTNNNVSVAMDPTSVTNLVGGVPTTANDFAFPQATEGALAAVNFGANLVVVSANDTTAPFTFASTTIRLSFSRNGGLTWTNHTIGGAGGAGVDVIDGQAAASTRNFAQVAYDRFGNLWISYLVTDLVAGTDRIIVGRSTSQGDTWAFVPLVDSLVDLGLGFGSLDRTSLCVGFATDPVFGNGQGTYVSFVDTLSFPNRVFVAGLFTTAFGFTPGVSPAPVQVDNPSVNTSKQHARCAVGPGGELYVTWLDFDPLAFPFTFRLMIDSDQDGLFAPGNFFDTVVDPDLIVDAAIPFPGAPRPVSVDFGPALPTPAIAVIRAGTHAGRIVIAYEEFNNSGIFQPQSLNLLTTYSDDFGVSWSTLQALAAPAPNSTPADQFLPAIATDDVTGRVYVTWYDTAGSAPTHDLTERFSASSADGASFGLPTALSAGRSSAPFGDGEFTDYGIHSGLAAFGGCVIAGWADNADTGGVGRLDAVVKVYQQSSLAVPAGP